MYGRLAWKTALFLDHQQFPPFFLPLDYFYFPPVPEAFSVSTKSLWGTQFSSPLPYAFLSLRLLFALLITTLHRFLPPWSLSLECNDPVCKSNYETIASVTDGPIMIAACAGIEDLTVKCQE